MDSVKCIGAEFYGDHPPPPQGSLFPSLHQFKICNMPNLEEWYAPSSKEGEELPAFPSLKELKLKGCPKLRTLPTTFALIELRLGGECNEMMLESSLVKVIGCLQSLVIKSFNKIETLPQVLVDNLPSTLTELCIQDCKELVCLPEGVMQNLTSLSFFDISDCPSLKVLPELGSRNYTSFQNLAIAHCPGLTSVSDCLRHLTTLEDLKIYDTPELKLLPDDFQDLTSLKYLFIGRLPQMTCLPEGLQQVAGTLRNLYISGCPGLRSLPEWMDKFTSLKYLQINMCHPDLYRRCAKETGEDWHKIPHNVYLNIGEPTNSKSRHGIGGGMKCNMIPCFSSSSSSTN